MKKLSVFIFFIFLSPFFWSQISITGPYTETFGTASISSWTDNSTRTGWYLTAGGTFAFGGTVNITAAAPVNTGAFYAYTCSGGTDLKLGSRPSNGSGGTAGSGTSYMGMRIKNTTGSTIQSVRITFTAYQMSLAENNSNVNKLTFSYQTGATVTSLTAGSWTSVTALDYTAPNNDASGGTSTQLNGYPCTVSSSLTACIAVTIANNNEIMLRWGDVNNAANDPHLAIDNVAIIPYSDNVCSIILPVELVNFRFDEAESELEWKTAKEENCSHFVVEKSDDGLDFKQIGTVPALNSIAGAEYTFKDYTENALINYYRLKIYDFNGDMSESSILSIQQLISKDFKCFVKDNQLFLLSKSTEAFIDFEVVDIMGYKLFDSSIEPFSTLSNIPLTNFTSGVYFLRFKDNVQQTLKFVVN